MTLEFHPYEVLDPNQYRKPTLQEKLAPLNQGINSALQLYQQSRQNNLQDINEALALQGHRRPDGSLDFSMGTGTPSTSLGQTTKPQPTPLFGAGQPDSQTNMSPLFSSPQPMTSAEPKPLFASAGTPDTGFQFQPGNPYNMPQQSGPTQPNMAPPRAMGMQAPAQPAGPNFAAMSPFERDQYLKGVQGQQAMGSFQRENDLAAQSNDLNSGLTRTAQSLASKMIPGMDFSKMTHAQIKELMPVIERYGASELSRQARSAAMGNKDQEEQDRLEQQARQQLVGIRGDASLKRVEEQRDAAIIAYNRLNEVAQSGKQLNPIDYTDILGQLYKARTGAAPTEKVLEEIRQQTAKGQLGKAYTYITGQQAPATTQDIVDSLKDMATSMGQQADKFHEGYMKTHLQFPTRLNPQTAESLRSLGRGMSFSDATGYKPGGGQPITKTINGKTYVKQNGQWYEQ